MRDVIEMAKEAGLFTHKEVQPEIERFAELVRADALAEQPAYRAVKTFHEGKPVYVAEQPAQQEPVALFKWLPEGATHIGRISVRTTAGGSLAMTTHAFKYEEAVLKVYITDNDNEYPGWRDAKDCFFHLNFPVLPLYTSPQAQRTWVGLTDEEFQMIYDMGRTPAGMMEMVEAKLKEKNT